MFRKLIGSGPISNVFILRLWWSIWPNCMPKTVYVCSARYINNFKSSIQYQNFNVCLLLHALSTVNIEQIENTIVKYPVFTSIELLRNSIWQTKSAFLKVMKYIRFQADGNINFRLQVLVSKTGSGIIGYFWFSLFSPRVSL